MSSNISVKQPVDLFTRTSIYLFVASLIAVAIGTNISFGIGVPLPFNLYGLAFGLRAYKRIDKDNDKIEGKIILLVNLLHALFISFVIAYFGILLFLAYFGQSIMKFIR